jgi:hypothetical protein
VEFTDGHVTGADCNPTRRGFVSGRHRVRPGHDVNPLDRSPASSRAADETTIAARLERAVDTWNASNQTMRLAARGSGVVVVSPPIPLAH